MNALEFAHPCTQRWFAASFPGATQAQSQAWPSIASGVSTLLLAPTGSGKTLAAFLVALDRLMFVEPKPPKPGVRVLYISPLKALGVDVQRNLRAPLAGMRAQAERDGVGHHVPTVGVRSGDTPAKERAQLARRPPEILITTPESLYLLLTSKARDGLAGVETVIVDEIHALVGTKRGTHLALSLERLEALRGRAHQATDATDAVDAVGGGLGALRPLQRIGLSATQRPLDEVATFLGGFDVQPVAGALTRRPVHVVDAGRTKFFELSVELPPEPPMPNASEEGASDFSAASGQAQAAEYQDKGYPDTGESASPSIWPSIHTRLLELIRAHKSTMVFVNSRRLAERLAIALNELAGEEMVLAHHGSISKDARADIEDRLKRGSLPAIIATSSLELGIDMGAVDLVVQVEAPPSVASGIQRIGRAGHQVGAISKGVLFPKFRGDLLACAALVQHVRAGHVEETRYPRNPLDVLAQQLVAAVALEPSDVDSLFRLVRGAAPFAELPRRSFENVLDMLSGRYPSDRFAELRPRVTWDRMTDVIEARRGSRMLSVVNGGTIPDRGLYGVYLATSEKSTRLGELDEEMVFESQPGDIFQLGATSWRIDEITADRVLVIPAPGEAGRMPFWHGDRPARPLEFGQAIGALTRQIAEQRPEQAAALLQSEHGLDPPAAMELVRYIADQMEATQAVPSDQCIVVERFEDAIGDCCVAILSPFGGRVHAPWATAIAMRLKADYGSTIDSMWSDEGMLFRLPELEAPPDLDLFFPAADELDETITRALADTALFAARFRENAGRALLLPKRRPGQRVPLWLQRRRSADLLSVASDFGDFPIVLETYRECLRDVFDLPGLTTLLQQINRREVSLRVVDTERASPFTTSLLFTWVGNTIYDGDTPVAERRARALSLDYAQLKELLGEPDLRALLDPEAIASVELALQRLEQRKARSADGVHDLLRDLGALTLEGLKARVALPESATTNAEDQAHERDACLDRALEQWLDELSRHGRVLRVTHAGEPHCIAAEDIARYRDALGVVPPQGVPRAFLEPVLDPLGDLVGRFARTHGPFTLERASEALGLPRAATELALQQLVESGRVVQGSFLPTGAGQEYCDGGVLKRIRRASMAKHRREVEAVEREALGRFLPLWHGIEPASQRKRGVDGLVSVIEQLEGLPLPVSDLERCILPARLVDFDPRDLDSLLASGEVLFQGQGALGTKDARIALYLADHFDLLVAPPGAEVWPGENEPGGAPSLRHRVFEVLARRGAVFFQELLSETQGFPADVLNALWDLVHAGLVTNDTLLPLRSLGGGTRAGAGSGLFGGRRAHGGSGRGSGRMTRGRVRGAARAGGRLSPPGGEGRWSLLFSPEVLGGGLPTPTERAQALVTQLLYRHGVLVTESLQHEAVPGGFSRIYPVLRAMEEAGRVRRGYFVADLGGAQFAWPGAEQRLRSVREAELALPDASAPARAAAGAAGGRPGAPALRALQLAATDPAQPYGATLPWPSADASPGQGRFSRSAGARVWLVQGWLAGYVSASGKKLITHLPEPEHERERVARALVRGLVSEPGASHLEQVDGVEPLRSVLAPYLLKAGYRQSARGAFRAGP